MKRSVLPVLGAGLLVACATADAPTSSGWRSLTGADVSAVCEHVGSIHPGMRDPQTPEFAVRVEEACATARARASSAQSYLDWRETLQALVTSFRDGHLGLRFNVEPERVRWPGFLVDGRRDGYVVRYAAGLPVAENAPPEGARLLSCDGVETEALLAAHIDGRSADMSKVPERLRQAYRLLVDMRVTGEPPFRQCAFQTTTGERVVDLAWSPIEFSQLNSALAAFTRRIVRGIEMEWLPDGGAWITLGNVRDEDRLTQLEVEMRTQQDRLRSAPYVVFDLRGGRGGNSMWGDRLASILWGRDAVEARRIALQSHDPAEYGKYWRASPAAAEWMRSAAAEFAAEGPDMADVAAFWRQLADAVEAQPEGDSTLMMDECCRPEPRPGASLAPAQVGDVFVLTDAGCFSSSVVAMNAFRRMGAIQVGEPSGQNEVYGESVGPIELPSGLARMWVPVSIIRQPRSELGGLPPDEWWPGAMDDDAGLRAWIAEMATARRTRR